MPRRGRRGYPTAVLVGLSQESANIWKIYSESVKPSKIIFRSENDEKSLYRFYEEIIDSLRDLLPEGFTSIILTHEDKTQFSINLRQHITKHHRWLSDKVTIKQLSGKARTVGELIQLIKNNKLQETINAANEETGTRIIEQLEKALENGKILYTIEELNMMLNSNKKPATILMTEEFQMKKQRNGKFNSAVQISKNLGTSVIIVKPTNPINPRLSQLGGFVCIISS
jgi:stalled ribosome rescue protein Dom34